MKYVAIIVLVFIGLFMLSIGAAVGYTVFLEMTRLAGDSDQEYGIYAYWTWIVLATIFVSLFSVIFGMIAVKKFNASSIQAIVIAFVVFMVSTIGVVATAVLAGFGVTHLMDGGF